MARYLKKLPGNLHQKFFDLVYDTDGEFHLNRTNLIKIFSRNMKGEINFYGSDVIEIDESKSRFVKNGEETTIGIFIFNKFILEDFIVFGYTNKIVDGKFIKKLHKELSILMLEKKVSTRQVADYLDKIVWLLGGPLSHIINPSLSPHILKLPASSKKLRESLFKEHKELLDKGDAVTAAKIEKQLVDHTREELSKVSETMDIFNSGSGVEFDNNYKTVFIMKGAVPDSREDNARDFNVITSNYDDGLSKDDFAANADSLVMGTYAKGKMTGVSGYYTKKYNSMFNRIEVSDKDSDCGTLKTMDITITPENKDMWQMYYYHMVSGKPVLITPATIDQYVGKTVKMRVPTLCEQKRPNYCNVCYGDLPYLLDQRRVGVTFALIPNTRMNANLKKFHNMTVKLYEISISDITRFMNR